MALFRDVTTFIRTPVAVMHTSQAQADPDSEHEPDLNAARWVLSIELKGLEALNRNLDGAFIPAIQTLPAPQVEALLRT